MRVILRAHIDLSWGRASEVRGAFKWVDRGWRHPARFPANGVRPGFSCGDRFGPHDFEKTC